MALSRNTGIALLCSILLVLLTAMPVIADTQDGSISGTVVDSSGVPLPGVTVSVSGTPLQGLRTAVTDGAGRYRVPLLPAGNGYLVLARIDGFQQTRQTGVGVRVAANTRVDFTLPPGGDLGEIIVSAEAPLLDTRRTASGETVRGELLLEVPVVGRSYLDALVLVPGISGWGNVVAHGAQFNDNVYLVDGVDTTDNAHSTLGQFFSQELVKEVEVKTGSFEAEYGRARGVITNVVTRSGGNEFHGSLPVYYTSDEFKRHQQSDRSTYQETDYEVLDVQATLGGPIKRDRLWFFAGLGRWRESNAGVNLFGEDITWHEYRDSRMLKLTLQASPSHKIVGEYIDGPSVVENIGSDSTNTMASAYASYEDRGGLTKLQWTGIISPETFVEARAALHAVHLSYGPQNADPGDDRIVEYLDAGGHVISGNVPVIFDSHRPRAQYHLVFNHYLSGLAGEHLIKAGVEYQDFEFRDRYDYPDSYAIRHGTDNQGNERQDTWLRQTSSDTTNRGSILTVFVQDQWVIGTDWTVNGGVRWERQEQKNDVGERILDYGSLVSPRIGVSWDVRGDGRSRVYAHFGRYYDAAGTLLGAMLNRTGTESWLYEGDYETGEWEQIGHTSPEVNPTQADPRLRPNREDEFVLGGELEVAPQTTAGIRLIHSYQKKMIEDVIGNEEAWRAWEEEDHWFYITNLRGARSRYQGLELTLRRRLSGNFQYLAGYTLSRSRGSVALDPQLATVTTDYADVKELIYNRYGYLPYDARHMVRAHGAWHGPWGLVLGIGLDWRTGRPYNRLGFIGDYVDDTNRLNGYGYRYFVDPRGSHRLPNYWSLDLRLMKRIPIRDTELSVFLNSFNTTNNQFVIARQEIDDEQWGQALRWQRAGYLELGARYSF